MGNCLTYGLTFTMLERLIKMDRFDYYMEFMSMRLDDPQFRLMYGINEFDKWYSDFMEILSQKHSEPMEENKP
jgi:hypothetical protein